VGFGAHKTFEEIGDEKPIAHLKIFRYRYPFSQHVSTAFGAEIIKPRPLESVNALAREILAIDTSAKQIRINAELRKEAAFAFGTIILQEQFTSAEEYADQSWRIPLWPGMKKLPRQKSNIIFRTSSCLITSRRILIKEREDYNLAMVRYILMMCLSAF
jgi:hypothetical protein